MAWFIPNALAAQQCVGYTSLTTNGDFTNWTPDPNPPFQNFPTNWHYFSTEPLVTALSNIQRITSTYHSAPYSVALTNDDSVFNANLISQGVSSSPANNYEFTFWARGFGTNSAICIIVADQPDPTLVFTGSPGSFNFYNFNSSSWTNAAISDLGQDGFYCFYKRTAAFDEQINAGIIPGSPTTNTYFYLLNQSGQGTYYYDDADFGTCDQVVTTTEIMLTATTTTAIENMGRDTQILVIVGMILIAIFFIDFLRRFTMPNKR
jgi:hypothetical protein